MTKFKVGDKVRATEECDNDFIDGEGIIRDIHSDGEFTMEVTKESRYYPVGRITPYVDWSSYIELAKNYVPKAPTHVVIWDEEDRDPCRLFTSEDEAKGFIKELSELSNVKEESILLVEIKSVRKVKIQKSLKYAQHKI